MGCLLCPTHWCRRLLEEHQRTGIESGRPAGWLSDEHVLGTGAKIYDRPTVAATEHGSSGKRIDRAIRSAPCFPSTAWQHDGIPAGVTDTHDGAKSLVATDSAVQSYWAGARGRGAFSHPVFLD